MTECAADGPFGPIENKAGTVVMDDADSGLAADTLTKPLPAPILKHHHLALTGAAPSCVASGGYARHQGNYTQHKNISTNN